MQAPRKVRWALALLVSLLSSGLGPTAVSGEPAAPAKRVVIQDQCPGRYCEFGPWVVEGTVTLRSEPSSEAPVIGTIERGERVQFHTGQVHSIPGVFRVHRAHDAYVPGDELRVLSYLGSGEWLIEHGGERRPEHLGFSPWGGDPGRRCELGEACWGTLLERFDWTFWAQFETAAGLVGWSKRWGP